METERTISDFLNQIAEDEDLHGQYWREAFAGVLSSAGLPPEKLEILLSNDLRRIRDAIQEENPGAKVFVIHVAPPC